jgi:glycosyltransferase involved in cell wall biosynthesis
MANCEINIVVMHPTGNRNVRAVLSSFEEAGLLAQFATTLAINPNSFMLKLLPVKIREELVRRAYPVHFSHIYSRPFLELSRNILPRIGFKNAVRHEKGFACVDSVYNDLDRNTAVYLKNLNKKRKINAVYAYEDGALETFKMAKTLGISCIYDLPIGYWRSARQLLNAERERWPDWAATLTGLRDSEEKLSRKDEELKLADKIFVASSFTARTLNNYPGELAPIEIIPYGFPPVINERIYADRKKKPLKLLFVGGLSQRKGIADLFAAVKNIGKEVELTVIGRKTSADCPALDAALKNHRWIPSLSHNEILVQMQLHDVLVFPSLFEGFGLVITEAMSQGTPVITTDRTAGPDLITHGKNGWIVEAGSTLALQEQIEILLQQPEAIIAAGKAAMESAKQRPWAKYGQELTGAIERDFSKGGIWEI